MRIVARTDPRAALAEFAAAQDESLTWLSRLIRKHDRYLARFVRMGVPRALRPADRQVLARYLGADERDLGAPNVPVEAPPPPARPKLRPRYSWYDARRAA